MSIRILTGDCRDVLKQIPDRTVQMVCTSPPYLGLRDYQVSGQIGLEGSPAEYISEIVSVFREIRRVLRDDGICFLNLGDSFANDTKWGGSTGGKHVSGLHGQTGIGRERRFTGLKPKNLMMIPARVAIALQEDDWILRSDIIWAKGNAMPEPTTDRPTSAHEHIFLLAKSSDSLFWTHDDGAGAREQPIPDYRWENRSTGEVASICPDGWPSIGKDIWKRYNLWSAHDYFYDGEAIKEGAVSDHPSGNGFKRDARLTYADANGARGNDRQWTDVGGTRNARNVWNIPTQPFAGSHFATFPPDLAERCIKAGTSEYGACAGCGAPWARTITKGEPDDAHRAACGADASGSYNGHSTKGHDAAGVQNASDIKRRILDGMRKKTYGWQPTCDCPVAEPVPCVVLDPFGGAGTTGLVADRLGRNSVLIELNPAYAEMARNRILRDAGMFADVTVEPVAALEAAE
jgi:DNA modification methylase